MSDASIDSAAASSRVSRRRLLLAGTLVLVVVALVVLGLVTGRNGDGDRGAQAVAETSAAQTSGAPPSATAVAPSTSATPPAVSSAPAPTTPTAVGDELPPSLPPVALTDTAAVDGAVAAELTDVRAIEGEGTGPGNVAGPAVAVTVRLTNGTAEELSLDGAVVSLTYTSDARPASPLDDPSAAPLSGALAPGSSAEGVYVFSVPADQRDVVSVAIGYQAGAPYLVFTGSVA